MDFMEKIQLLLPKTWTIRLIPLANENQLTLSYRIERNDEEKVRSEEDLSVQLVEPNSTKCVCVLCVTNWHAIECQYRFWWDKLFAEFLSIEICFYELCWAIEKFFWIDLSRMILIKFIEMEKVSFFRPRLTNFTGSYFAEMNMKMGTRKRRRCEESKTEMKNWWPNKIREMRARVAENGVPWTGFHISCSG